MATIVGWLQNPWIFGLITLITGVALYLLTAFGILKAPVTGTPI
jgi:hypothetical protein